MDENEKVLVALSENDDDDDGGSEQGGSPPPAVALAADTDIARLVAKEVAAAMKKAELPRFKSGVMFGEKRVRDMTIAEINDNWDSVKAILEVNGGVI